MENIFEGIELGIGTWAWGDRLFWEFGSRYKEVDLKAAFNACLSSRIEFFDTAEVYGEGKSEEFIGKFLTDYVREHDSAPAIKIATKYMPFPWRLGRKNMEKALRRSLARLNQKQVWLYQVHMPLWPARIDAWMRGMLDLYEKGLLLHVGVSNFSRKQLDAAWAILDRSHIPLASNQVEYHLLNRSIEKNGVLAACREKNVQIIAYSPLAKGILTGKYSPVDLPTGMRGRQFGPTYLRTVLPLLQELKRIGTAHAGKTPAQVALNWLLCKGVIPIPGVKSSSQVVQNAGALGWRLSAEEVEKLDMVSDRVNEEVEKI